jgi:hypothetical protein
MHTQMAAKRTQDMAGGGFAGQPGPAQNKKRKSRKGDDSDPDEVR